MISSCPNVTAPETGFWAVDKSTVFEREPERSQKPVSLRAFVFIANRVGAGGEKPLHTPELL